MILQVRADQPNFKEVTFGDDFNVVLAERAEESTKKDSRNGLGKTTLLEIIHFCLGEGNTPSKKLKVPELQGWTFSLDIILRGKKVTVSRNTTSYKYVLINADTDWSEWLIKPDFVNNSQAQLKLDNWRKLLGWLTYDLPIDDNRDYIPKYRSLISYVIRTDQFDEPFENYPRQSTWDVQVHNAFMLDLNWEYARDWQFLRERKDSLENLKKATRGGNSLLASILGSIGELESNKARLERLIEKENHELETFQVHPQYERIQDEANTGTEQIHNLSNEILKTQRLIEFYEHRLVEEQSVSDSRVSDIYKEVGVIFPDRVLKHLNEVQAFHNEVAQNRRRYLQNEVKRLRNEINKARQTVEELSLKRSQNMRILSSYGALDEYNQLQQRHTSHIIELEAINSQIANLKKIEREESQIKIEQERLFLEARTDYDERKTVKKARDIFNENSEYLYEAPGDLIVDIKKSSGYSFKVDIKRSGSDGIDKMKVFCYDLMLAELWSESNQHPHFLVHDSTIFADVDERQIARALELAARKSKEFGFQYIALLNSDKVPWNEISQGLDIRDSVRLILSDDRPEGSLLGVRF